MQLKRVEIMDILSARDERAEKQRSMLAKYSRPLISFTMNIAGSIKLDEEILRAYREGKKLIENVLDKNRVPVLDMWEKIAFTGCECIWTVDADAEIIKARMQMIEDAEEIGRLFDIDVIDTNGYKIERKSARKCLICDQDVHICARSRRHSAEELFARAKEIIHRYFEEEFIERTAQSAQKALLNEALTTPKPGLVDCENKGAHDDMDIFSFAASACALKEYFKKSVRIGMDMKDVDACERFRRLQYEGIKAEEEMLLASSGANTHKGALFSMGILCCAAGMAGENAGVDELLACAAETAAPSLEMLKNMPENQVRTGGERQYFASGYTGARGEAALGFPTAKNTALPAFKKAISEGKSLNDAGLYALCALMAEVCDSNILRRAGEETLEEVRCMAQKALGNGAEKETLRQMNDIFVSKHISPGGSADLLALTYFLYEWESREK